MPLQDKGWDRRQLAALLSMTVDGDAEGVALDGQIRSALDELLATPLADLGLGGGDGAVAEALTCPDTDRAVLEAIKNCGRSLVQAAACDVDRAVGTAVFYAALAAAQVAGAALSTSLRPEALRAALRDLAGKEWMPDPLRRLLKSAASTEGTPDHV